MKSFFSIENFFLHQKLALQILDPVSKSLLLNQLKTTDRYENHLKEFFVHTVYTDTILQFLENSKTPSLEEKLFKNEKIEKGELIWFESNFYFKGINEAYDCFHKGATPCYTYFRITLKRYNNLKIEGRFNFEHTIGTSVLDRLSGQKNKFILAYIEEITIDRITLRPILIGDKILNKKTALKWDTYSLRVSPEEIDEFREIEKVPFDSVNIDLNKTIPEQTLKQWFAEIINEGNIPKDWGGETSDLFTNHIHINQKRVNAAFLLKGPSKFHQMSLKDLGANGNQIVRLFDEPADVFIIQHCHYIKSEIYKMMEAFAGQFYKLSRYCVIDGNDTQRILKAYKKI